jgi:hypothetical protein
LNSDTKAYIRKISIIFIKMSNLKKYDATLFDYEEILILSDHSKKLEIKDEELLVTNPDSYAKSLIEDVMRRPPRLISEF